MGGSSKLRGYNDRRYHDDITPELIGTSYLLSNTELRYRLPMNKSIEAVLFFDAGQMDNLFDHSVLKSDYGIGFRYNVPYIGMIRIDQAWTSDGDSRVSFSMGELF
jgi:outer membrane protein assembly factor BamA